MENIKHLQKLAEVFDTDKIITSDEIEQVLKGILVIMNSFKKDNQTLNKETKEVVEILLDKVLTENAKLKELVNRETSDTKEKVNEKLEKSLNEIKGLIAEFKAMKPEDGKPGKDADEEKIVEDVLAKIKLPEYEVYTLEEKGEDIVAEINALPLEDEYKIDASHIKNLPESKGGTFNGGGWRNLYQLHDVELSSPTDNQVLTYDSTSNTWKNENSAGGGTVGPGTINEIAYFDTTTSIASLSTATYPSLTELSYVKGVTSSIQTQLNGKASTTAYTLAGVSAISTDATKSLYTMTSTIPVEYRSSDGNTLLFLDETNERIGVGTNAPAETLSIQAATLPFLSTNFTDNTSYGGIRFKENGTILGAFLQNGSNFATSNRRNVLEFQSLISGAGVGFWTTNGSGTLEKVFIDGDGNTGFGVRPAAFLHVAGTTAVTSGAAWGTGAISGVGTTLEGLFSAYDATNDIAWMKAIHNNTAFKTFRIGANNMSFWTDNNTGGLLERMTILTSGNVGVNTNAPNVRLHVYGTNTGGFLKTESTSTGSSNLMSGYLTQANADQLGGFWDFYTASGTTPDFFGKLGFKFEGGTSGAARHFQLYVGDASTPKVVVNSTGMGIGTISPAYKLHIEQAGAANSFVGTRIKDTSSASTGIFLGSLRDSGNSFSLPGLWLTNSTPDYTNYAFLTDGSRTIFNAPGSQDINFRTNNGNVMVILNGGNVGIGTTSPDRLLHEEVSDSGTNAVVYGQRHSHITSGTATTGFGIGEEYELENASGTNRIAATQEFTWTDATNATEDGLYTLKVMLNGTLATPFTVSGSALAITGTINATSNISSTANIHVGATGLFYWTNRSIIDSPADGVVRLTNFAGTDFGRLQFGGTTSSFPSLKRSTTGFALRLADDSASTWQLASKLVEANTAGSGSPNIITEAESGTVFTNEGSAAQNYHTLPTAVAGLTFTFYVDDADGIRVTANTGDIIQINGVASSVAGYTECTAIGGSLTLTAINATDWVATSSVGSWSLA